MVISLYVVALGVSMAVTIGFGVLTWRRRPEPGTRALGVLLASVVVWTGLYAVALSTPDQQLQLWLHAFITVVVVISPVAWIVFALQYTGHGDQVTRRLVGALSVPGAAMVPLVFTNPVHHLVWQDYNLTMVDGIAVLQQAYGPAFWLFAIYAYTLVMAGMVLLLRLVFTADHLFADQALALLVGSLVPLVANVITLAGLGPIDGLDVTPYAFSISGATFGYALYNAGLLDRVPATRRIGRNAVVRNMRDGVIVVDDCEDVIDINSVAERQFDCESDEVIGRPLEAVVGDPDFEVPATEETVVWSADGPREYEIKGSRLTDQHDRLVGRVLVVRDITDRTNRRQQLQVLNRVLRHNFRNDMNVIDVCSTQLTERLSGEDAELASRIRMVARDLAETGTKAREIEQIMSARDNDPQPIDLPSLVRRQVDTLRHEYADIEVETDLPDRLEIRSTGILESALQNVLENAVVHNDSDEPWIGVTITEDSKDSTVDIAVADNGPGIPSQEREVLVKGTETPLEHGSGLGLWLVNWGVSMLGGDVEFSDNEPRGSVVTIRVPHRQPVVDHSTDPSGIDAS